MNNTPLHLLADFLRLVVGPAPDETLEIRVRRDGRWLAQQFADVERAAQEALELGAAGCDVYYGLGPRRPGAAAYATDADVPGLRALVIDLDPSPRLPLPRWRQLVEAALRALVIPPSAIQCSGRGLYALWVLERRIPPDRWRRLARELVRRLRALGADPAATNPSRVFRCPGTLNHKMAPARLAYLLDDGREWRRWSAEELERALGLGPERARPPAPPPPPAALVPCLEAALAHWPETEGLRHRLALILGAALRDAGVAEEDAVARVLAAAQAAGDDDPRDRERAVRDVFQGALKVQRGCEDTELRRLYPCTRDACPLYRAQIAVAVQPGALEPAAIQEAAARLLERADVVRYTGSVHLVLEDALLDLEDDRNIPQLQRLLPTRRGERLVLATPAFARAVQAELVHLRARAPEILEVRRAPALRLDGTVTTPGIDRAHGVIQFGAPARPREPGAMLDALRDSVAWATPEDLELYLAYAGAALVTGAYRLRPMLVLYPADVTLPQGTGKTFLVELLTWILGGARPAGIDGGLLRPGAVGDLRRALVAAAKAAPVIYFGNVEGEATGGATIGADTLADLLTRDGWDSSALYRIGLEQIENHHVIALSTNGARLSDDLSARAVAVALDPLRAGDVEAWREAHGVDRDWWRARIEELRNELLGWTRARLMRPVPREARWGHFPAWKALAARLLGRPVPPVPAAVRTGAGGLDVLWQFLEAERTPAELRGALELLPPGLAARLPEVWRRARSAAAVGRLLSHLAAIGAGPGDGRRVVRRVLHGSPRYVLE